MDLLAKCRLQSAIPLSLVKPQIKNWNKSRYGAIFNKYGSGNGPEKYRIYIPMGEQLEAESPAPEEIIIALARKGYTVDSYKAGIAVDKSGKRKIRIGKLLSDDPELLKQFTNDAGRAAKSGNLLMVISRHPYDVLGMSFDRGWTSCMNLTEGLHRSYLTADVKLGTVVAYLVKSDDRNINRPIARIALRPAFLNGRTKNSMILCPGPMYGQGSNAFSLNVEKFAKWANSGSPKGKYKMSHELYTEDYGEEEYDKGGNLIINHGLTPDDVLGLPVDSQISLASYSNSFSVLTQLVKAEDIRVAESLIRNPSVTSDLLNQLVNRADVLAEPFIVNKIAKHRNVSAGTLKILSTHPVVSVRTIVASNSRTDSMTLLRMTRASNEDPYVLRNLVENPNTPAIAMDALADSEYTAIKIAVARRPDTPMEVVDKLIKSESTEVRMAAIRNPNISQDALNQLSHSMYNAVPSKT